MFKLPGLTSDHVEVEAEVSGELDELQQGKKRSLEVASCNRLSIVLSWQSFKKTLIVNGIGSNLLKVRKGVTSMTSFW